MKHLDIELSKFPFYEREKNNGKVIKNKCGRDFLYYAISHYKPNTYTPKELDKLFGISVPFWLAWTQVQFLKTPTFLQKQNLTLYINKRKISSFIDFVRAILFSRISLDEALDDIESAVDNNVVSGIDISIGFGGLLDHVMFVYGYDENNLYVFETTEALIEYKRVVSEYPKIMRLSKEEVRKRFTRFGRVWKLESK